MEEDEVMDTRRKMEDTPHSKNIMGMIEGEVECRPRGEAREGGLCRDHQPLMGIEVAMTLEADKVEAIQTAVQSGEEEVDLLWTEMGTLIPEVSIVSAAIRLKLTFTSTRTTRPRHASSKTVEDPSDVPRSDCMG